MILAIQLKARIVIQKDEGKKENDEVEIVDITKEILRPGLSFKTKESAKKSLQRIFMLVFV